MDYEIKQKYEECFEKFKEKNPDWERFLTDSTYYDLMEFYSCETKQYEDEDKGYPDDVYAFAHYCWMNLMGIVPTIDGPVFIKELDSGVLYVLINIDRKWVSYEINPVYIERCLTLSIANDTYDSKRIVSIPMGEGFNAMDYLITATQCKDQITLILVHRKNIIGGKSKQVNTKDITEECKVT